MGGIRGLIVACCRTIVAVLNLSPCVRRFIARITEDCIDTAIRRACGLHPTVLHITVARIGNTGRGERALNTEVIDMTAEVSEERLVQSVDGVSFAMQRTVETSVGGAYRRPVGIGLRSLVGMEEEVEVAACLHTAVEGRVAFQSVDTEVVEVLQQIDTALGITAIVVQVDLTVALHLRMIDIEVVLGIGHDSLQVVVVGHTERHVVRVGLTQIGLGVVSQILTILIPIDRCRAVEGDTIAMTLGIILIGEDLPATA